MGWSLKISKKALLAFMSKDNNLNISVILVVCSNIELLKIIEEGF